MSTITLRWPDASIFLICRSASPSWCCTTNPSLSVSCVAFFRHHIFGGLSYFASHCSCKPAGPGLPPFADPFRLWANHQGSLKAGSLRNMMAKLSLQAVFFIAGAPIWMSFYSIWLFEAGLHSLDAPPCWPRFVYTVSKTSLATLRGTNAMHILRFPHGGTVFVEKLP